MLAVVFKYERKIIFSAWDILSAEKKHANVAVDVFLMTINDDSVTGDSLPNLFGGLNQDFQIGIQRLSRCDFLFANHEC